MRKFAAIFIALVSVLLSGCVAAQLKGMRDRIPVGYAGSVDGSIFIMAGGSATITGKNIEKPSKNVITADSWEEKITTPWGTSTLTLKDAGIGTKKPVVAPTQPSDTTSK